MKFIRNIALLPLLILLLSCGEDRSGEYYALIEDRMWIEETMRANYLWYEEIPEIKESDYFQEPETFFKNLLYKQALNGKGDKYSYMEETNEDGARSLMLDRTSTYGMEFDLYTDPTGTTNHIFARILYVLKDSPAAKAGIRRGDWISAFNKTRINTNNYSGLKNGGEISLARERIIQTENGFAWQTLDTVQVASSVPMEINPIYYCSIYERNNIKTAYLVYNEFSTGPEDKPEETAYINEMIKVFGEIKKHNPDEFILDLRYNNGGYLQCAQTLASLLMPAEHLGKTLFKLTFNDKQNPQVANYIAPDELAAYNLNLKRIYILTGSHTASSSEAVINALIPYMGKENVILIGTPTEGKNVAMVNFKNGNYGLSLWPVVAYVANADNESDYISGFTPTYQLDERIYTHWYELGNENEYLLNTALSLIHSRQAAQVISTRAISSHTTGTSISKKGIIIQKNQ